MKRLLLSNLLLFFFFGCVRIPERVTPVDRFDIHRYLGQWFEIARLDHSFERGLSHVSAHYSMRDDGGVKVLNRGYSEREKTWKQVEGKAYFVQGDDIGYLKVSFFGPFYGSYVIFDLDREHYSYALVCGPEKSYLWILSRTPHMETDQRNALVAKAAELGFDTQKLIFVDHRDMESDHSSKSMEIR